MRGLLVSHRSKFNRLFSVVDHLSQKRLKTSASEKKESLNVTKHTNFEFHASLSFLFSVIFLLFLLNIFQVSDAIH